MDRIINKGVPIGTPLRSLSKNLKITHVSANQSADWCGDLLKRTKVLDFLMKMFENLGDCHVGLRPPRNDTPFLMGMFDSKGR